MNSRTRVFATCALLLTAVVPTAQAQLPDCTYDRCALRLEYRVFSTPRLVQGADARAVARIGLFVPRIELFTTAADSARAHYDAFHTYHNRGAAFLLVGAAVYIGSSIWLAANPYGENLDVYFGLNIVGLGFFIASVVDRISAADRLQRAIWFYNRGVATGR